MPRSAHGDFVARIHVDPIIHRIESRIALYTGIPIHPDEDMIHFARITPRGSHPRDGYYAPFGLHSDSDTRPHRAKTVIVYLEGVIEGGRTIFPLCHAPVLPEGPVKELQSELEHVSMGSKAIPASTADICMTHLLPLDIVKGKRLPHTAGPV